MKIGSGSFAWPGAEIVVTDEPLDATASLAAIEQVRAAISQWTAENDRPTSKEELIEHAKEVWRELTGRELKEADKP